MRWVLWWVVFIGILRIRKRLLMWWLMRLLNVVLRFGCKNVGYVSYFGNIWCVFYWFSWRFFWKNGFCMMFLCKNVVRRCFDLLVFYWIIVCGGWVFWNSCLIRVLMMELFVGGCLIFWFYMCKECCDLFFLFMLNVMVRRLNRWWMILWIFCFKGLCNDFV